MSEELRRAKLQQLADTINEQRALTQRPAAQEVARFEAGCNVLEYLKQEGAPYRITSQMLIALHGDPEGRPAPQQATPGSACKVCQGTGDAPLATKYESLCNACYGTGETLTQATPPKVVVMSDSAEGNVGSARADGRNLTPEEIAQVTGYTIPTPDDSFTAITYQTNDIGFFVDATEAARKQKALFFVNGFHDSVFGQSTPGWSYTQTRRVDENTVDIGRMVAFADERATPEPVGEPLQGGLENDALLNAWRSKLPGVTPTDAQMTAFALGVEVGFAHARTLERSDWSRVHEALQAAGVHPGRTDDHLADVIAKALANRPAPGVPEDVQRDAERYRFIRDANRSDCITREISLYAMESLDEYVDAAMEGETAALAAAQAKGAQA